MFSLGGECHFWSTREEIQINPTDYGAFRYYRQREIHQQQQQQLQDVMFQAKRDYTEARDGLVTLKNTKANGNLKDSLKKLEELLAEHKVVYSRWKDGKQLLLLFEDGVMVHLCVEICTGDIKFMLFEKYLMGKLAVEAIEDAFLTRSHIVLSYNTNQLTVVHLQLPPEHEEWPEKIPKLDPSIFHVIIPGPAERKLARHLSVNATGDMFVVWTYSSQNEVYPWRPTIKDQDRANIHVFKIEGLQLESLAYCWTENDPLIVEFLRLSDNQIITVEQKVSRKGETSAEICSYEITSGKMTRNFMSSIAVNMQICSCAFSPDQEKLFLGCIDHSLYMHDLVSQNTRSTPKIEIAPQLCSWHADSSLIMLANEHAHLQCFDLALTPVGLQLVSDDYTPVTLFDLSHYFTMKPKLLDIAFSLKPEMSNYAYSDSDGAFTPDAFLLLKFEGGPLACLRLFSAAGIAGDINNSGLTSDVIIHQYLSLDQFENAVNLFTALNWETYGAMCLLSLHKIANHVFYSAEGGKAVRRSLLQKALDTFTDDLSEETLDEFSDQVFDLRRRFFFHLLLNELYLEAFDVAQGIGDYDLFMDLYHHTNCNPEMHEFSQDCYNRAENLWEEEQAEEDDDESYSGSSTGNSATSDTNSCRDSTYSPPLPNYAPSPTSGFWSQGTHADSHGKSYVPTLTGFKSKVYNDEMLKINIPKPELRSEASFLTTPPLNAEVRLSKAVPTSSITPTNKEGSRPEEQKGSLRANEDCPDNYSHSKNINFTGAGAWTPPTQTVGLPRTSKSPVRNAAYDFEAFQKALPMPSSPSNHLQKVPIPQHPLTLVDKPLPLYSGGPPHPAELTYNAPPPLPPAHLAFHPKYYQHPLVLGTIPPYSRYDDHRRLPPRRATPNSILAKSQERRSRATQRALNGNKEAKGVMSTVSGGASAAAPGPKPASGGPEKNKVKFSDTIQVAVVPEIPRKDKPAASKRNGGLLRSAMPARHLLTNPKKELAESLPLCHPNGDYLKQFNPASSMEALNAKPKMRDKSPAQEAATNAKEDKVRPVPPPPPPTTQVKVVHFGMV